MSEKIEWKRVRPGQYEYRRSGVLLGIVERSSMMPWRWWWSAWGEDVDATGDTASYAKAKDAVWAAHASE